MQLEHQILPVVILLFVALAGNLPLGYLRATVPKFSLRWIIYIHASIPVLIILRQLYGFGWHWIPATLFCAVTGQILGGWLRRYQQ